MVARVASSSAGFTQIVADENNPLLLGALQPLPTAPHVHELAEPGISSPIKYKVKRCLPELKLSHKLPFTLYIL